MGKLGKRGDIADPGRRHWVSGVAARAKPFGVFLSSFPLSCFMLFDLIPAELEAFCSFPPIFGDGRLNECMGSFALRFWYEKSCLW